MIRINNSKDRKRHFVGVCLVLSTLLLLIAGCSRHETNPVHASTDNELLRKFVANGELTDECTVGIYTIRTHRTAMGDGSLEILKSGQTIYGQHGWAFQIGDRGTMCKDSGLDLIGGDLTGNGKANLVIYEWSGGAHCCFTMFLFEMDEEVKQIAEIDGRDSVPEFTDIDGDSVAELSFYDKTYAYWPGCYADSPCPRVILRWSNGSYIIAQDLMSSPAPSIQELENKAAKIRKSEIWTSGANSGYDHYYIPKELFSNALDLMYAGHEDLGWKFIEMAWTEKFPVDKELLEELRKRMASSPYWAKIQLANTGKDRVHILSPDIRENKQIVD